MRGGNPGGYTWILYVALHGIHHCLLLAIDVVLLCQPPIQLSDHVCNSWQHICNKGGETVQLVWWWMFTSYCLTPNCAVVNIVYCKLVPSVCNIHMMTLLISQIFIVVLELSYNIHCICCCVVCALSVKGQTFVLVLPYE